MIPFNKIEYPTCPNCNVLQNSMQIFSLDDFTTPYFKLKNCLSCKKPFLLKVRVELLTEAVPVEDY